MCRLAVIGQKQGIVKGHITHITGDKMNFAMVHHLLLALTNQTALIADFCKVFQVGGFVAFVLY